MDDSTRNNVWELKGLGYTDSQIAASMKMSEATVARILNDPSPRQIAESKSHIRSEGLLRTHDDNKTLKGTR